MHGCSLWVVDDRTRDGATLAPPRLFGPRAWYRRREESLQAHTVVDDLTGLRNQRALWRELSRRAATCAESPMAVLMLDLDHLDELNERHGYDIGDAVLRRAAAVLRDVAPSPRLAFRYGGEEFVLLVPGDGDVARAVAEQARAAIASQNGEIPAVTVSCGVAPLNSPVEPWVALDRADAALRGAKRAGRDRVVVAGASPHTADAYLIGAVEREAPRRAALALAVASSVPVRHGETAAGTEDVLTLCEAIGRRLGLEGVALDRLLAGSQLHDVGKVAVPPEIFNKPGLLTADERAIVGEHTVIGEGILRSVPEMAEVATIVRHSHEHWDGSGYPDGLSGEQIPLASRIILCADAFHAIRSDRPYRAGRAAAEALQELRACAGTQFDPAVVGALVEVAESVRRQEADPAVVTALPRSRRLVSLLLALTISTGTAFAAIPEVRDLVRSLLGTSTGISDMVQGDAGDFSFGPLGDVLSLAPTQEPGKGARPGSAAPSIVPLALAVQRSAADGAPPAPRPAFPRKEPKGQPPGDGGTPRGNSPQPTPVPPAPGRDPAPGPGGPGPGVAPGLSIDPTRDQGSDPPQGGGKAPVASPPRGSDPTPNPGRDPDPGPGPGGGPGTDPGPGPGTDPDPPPTGGKAPVPRRPEQSPSRNDEAQGDGSPGRPDDPGRTDPPRGAGNPR